MGCVGLTVAGGALEIAGFGLIAYELVRIQRREFGEPELLSRLRVRIRKIFRRPKHQRVIVGSAVASAEGAGRVRARVRKGPGHTLEDRVEAIEKNFEHLEAETDQDRANLEGSIDEVRKKLGETRAELEQERREGDEERRASLRASVTLQAWGTGFFIVGAIFSVLGNAVSC